MSKIYQIASAAISDTDKEHIFLTDSMDCFPYYPDLLPGLDLQEYAAWQTLSMNNSIMSCHEMIFSDISDWEAKGHACHKKTKRQRGLKRVRSPIWQPGPTIMKKIIRPRPDYFNHKFTKIK